MTTTRRISTTAALILSLAAAGAPAVSARPTDPDMASAANGQSSTAVRPNPDQQAVTGATANRTSGAVYSRPDKSLISVTPPATSSSAVGRAALLRSLAQQQRRRVAGLTAYREGQIATALDVGATAANKASAPQAVVRIHGSQSGFDWGDAGIGAAGGIALSMIGLGGALGVSQRRARRTRRTTAALPS